MYRILTRCRACQGPISQVMSLGHSPLANSLTASRDEAMSLPRYPLNLCVCAVCGFVQLDIAIESRVLFEHYVYVTPHARSLGAHYEALISVLDGFVHKAKPLTEMRVVEMGSNNGAFLRAIRPSVRSVVGIEPAKNIAEQANRDGIPTIPEFFTEDSVQELREKIGPVDMFVARHCMAHLDDLPGTLRAISEILSDDGIAVIENAYLRSTLNGTQFDQIYHEHMSYFALRSLSRLMRACGLYVQHAHVAGVHGGSIVVIASKKGGPVTAEHDNVWNEEDLLDEELHQFAFRTHAALGGLRESVRHLLSQGFEIHTYGATAKGNTLLNAIGLSADDIPYAVDSTPLKQGKYLPGSGVLVMSEQSATQVQPNIYLLTAWNYAEEIMGKQWAFREAGGRFLVPLPFPRLIGKR